MINYLSIFIVVALLHTSSSSESSTSSSSESNSHPSIISQQPIPSKLSPDYQIDFDLHPVTTITTTTPYFDIDPHSEVPTSVPTSLIIKDQTEINEERTLKEKPGYFYPTRTHGKYCHIGMGMSRTVYSKLEDTPSFIVTSSMYTKFCPDVTYCFRFRTGNSQIMIDTFGPKLGDAEWDGTFYDDFFVLGCQGDYGTTSFTNQPKCLTNEQGGSISGANGEWEVRPQPASAFAIDLVENPPAVSNATDENGVLIPIDLGRQIFELEYCCYNNYCSGVGSLFHGGLGVSFFAALVGVLGMFVM